MVAVDGVDLVFDQDDVITSGENTSTRPYSAKICSFCTLARLTLHRCSKPLSIGTVQGSTHLVRDGPRDSRVLQSSPSECDLGPLEPGDGGVVEQLTTCCEFGVRLPYQAAALILQHLYFLHAHCFPRIGFSTFRSSDSINPTPK